MPEIITAEDLKNELKALRADWEAWEKSIREELKNVEGGLEKLKKLEELQKEQAKMLDRLFSEGALITNPENVDKKRTMGKIKFLRGLFKGDVGLVQECWKLFKGEEVKANELTEGTNTTGGYFVPEEWAKEIIDRVKEEDHLRKYCTVIDMNTDTKHLGAIVSGFTPYWITEAGTITNSAWQLGQTTLTPKKLAALAYPTSELIADANVSIIQLIEKKLATALGNEEDNQILNGTGVSPAITGVFNDSSVNIVQMSAGNTQFANVSYDDIVDVETKLKTQYRPNARWIFHREILGILKKLKDSNNNPLLVRDPQTGQPTNLLGYPFVMNEYSPDVTNDSAADTGFIAFGDFSGVVIGDRQRMSLAISTDVKFEQDLVGIRVIQRVDIAVADPDAIVVLKTSAI